MSMPNRTCKIVCCLFQCFLKSQEEQLKSQQEHIRHLKQCLIHMHPISSSHIQSLPQCLQIPCFCVSSSSRVNLNEISIAGKLRNHHIKRQMELLIRTFFAMETRTKAPIETHRIHQSFLHLGKQAVLGLLMLGT